MTEQLQISKSALLEAMQSGYEEWENLLVQLDEATVTRPGASGTWSIKDVLGHIISWQRLTLARLEPLTRGEEFVPDGPKKTIDEWNARFYLENRDKSLAELQDEARTVYRQVVTLVENLSEEQLNDPAQVKWLGGSPAWKWIEGNTYEHYQEHVAAIKEWLDKGQN